MNSKSNRSAELTRLLIVRHGVAVDAAEWSRRGGKTRSRPLTRAGRRKMRRGAKGLARLVPAVDWVITSPLVRARQTAEIVAARYKGARTATAAALIPGRKPAETLEYLRALGHKTIAVVGHEPDLSVLASWLTSGLQESFLVLKKGGACLIEFERDIRAGRGKLIWLAKPGQLREAGK